MNIFRILLIQTVLCGFHPSFGYGAENTSETSTGQKLEESLDLLEEQAFLEAANFAQNYVVQIETFGNQDAASLQSAALGPFSGTVLDQEGWIVSSNHFFRSQPASITVVLKDGVRKAAKLVARDFSREIALLKIEADAALTPAPESSENGWQVGQWTIALGKSFDAATASRSIGILSAKGRIWNKAIQTDCKISPQNYGGPLIDLFGNCMGILTTLNPGISTEGEVEQWYDSGIGFAIPLSSIRERLPVLKSGKDIHTGQAGFGIKTADEFAVGLSVAGVSPGSPAFKSGLKAGDEILKAGGSPDQLQPVSTYTQLKHVLGPLDAEQKLVLEVKRPNADASNETLQIDMSLVQELPKYREPYLGIVIAKNLDASEQILQIAPDSPALKANLKIGDQILQVNDEILSQEKTIADLVPFLDFREPLRLKLKREAETLELTLQPTPRPNGDVQLGAFQMPEAAVDPSKVKQGETVSKGVVQIPLGDIKNKAFAIVPNNYKPELPHGLLVVYAEAGIHESKVWSDLWEHFCGENRWICVVLQSAEESHWTFEEVEVGKRVSSYMESNYSLDPRRSCVAGFGSGGVMALVNSTQFKSLWLSDAKIPNRLRLTPASPEDTRRCFLNGSDPGLEKLSKMLDDSGYNYVFNPNEIGTLLKADAANVQDNAVFEQAQRWLKHLEAL